MTFSAFLCRVCERSVHGFVHGLFECENVIFQALKHFVHGVHTNARTYMRKRVRICAHAHTCAHMRMHKPYTLCTLSSFSFKNNGIDVFKTLHKLCTNPAHCARF